MNISSGTLVEIHGDVIINVNDELKNGTRQYRSC